MVLVDLLYFFGVSWHGWLIPFLPSWFLADGLERHRATASGPFLVQGIDRFLILKLQPALS